jgi:transposase
VLLAPPPISPKKKCCGGGNRIRAPTAANAGSSCTRRSWTHAPPSRRPAHCGVSPETGHQLISAYNRRGVAAVETPGKGGRRNQYLTLEQEQEFLAPFFAQAQVGTIATAAQIKQAFEARVGQEVADTTIYRFLDRHGWRKLVPRPAHPKADLAEQAVFKKTSSRRSMPSSPRAVQTTSDRSS